ncbi:MAG: peptide chain release factor N(5)-glutamine methyltransferase [Candidatus Dormibacteria bacterium]
MAAPTLVEVVRKSTAHLRDHGSPSARLDAELLCAHALGLRRLDLYLQYDRPLRPEELEPIRALLRRRSRGEPVAYLTGSREFFGRDFAVSAEVLIPRPDTEVLVGQVLEWARARAQPLRLADLGTGSGCIAATLAAELPGAEVVATELARGAADVARENCRRLGVEQRVQVLEGSWTAPLLTCPGRFDVIVSNPPYVAAEELAGLSRDVRDFEPHAALLPAGDALSAYRGLLDGLAGLLAPAAMLALEVDPRRAERVAALVAEALPGGRVRAVDDLTARPRVVVATVGD